MPEGTMKTPPSFSTMARDVAIRIQYRTAVLMPHRLIPELDRC